MQVDDPTQPLIDALRRAITATRGDLALLRARCQGDEERAALDDVGVSLDAMRGLVDRLASFAALDDLARRPQVEVPATIALESALRRAEAAAGLRGVTLRGSSAWPDVAVLDRGDALSPLLDAMLQQAALHTPRGGRVAVSAEVEGDRLAVTVSDAGAAVVDFDAWSSLDAQLEARARPGVRRLGGLGLYLLTRWCAALDATLSRALTEGRPSLTVRLPVRVT